MFHLILVLVELIKYSLFSLPRVDEWCCPPPPFKTSDNFSVQVWPWLQVWVHCNPSHHCNHQRKTCSPLSDPDLWLWSAMSDPVKLFCHKPEQRSTGHDQKLSPISLTSSRPSPPPPVSSSQSSQAVSVSFTISPSPYCLVARGQFFYLRAIVPKLAQVSAL